MREYHSEIRGWTWSQAENYLDSSGKLRTKAITQFLPRTTCVLGERRLFTEKHWPSKSASEDIRLKVGAGEIGAGNQEDLEMYFWLTQAEPSNCQIP